MNLTTAAAFAAEKLENEVEREFDGAAVSKRERRQYLAAIRALRLAADPNGDVTTRCEHCDNGTARERRAYTCGHCGRYVPGAAR